MSSLFGQLGYNFTDNSGTVTNFTDDVIDNLSRLPPLLEDWQYTDLKNNDSAVTNYLKNPTKPVTQQIITKVNQILSVSSGVGNLGGIVSSCLNIVDHTIAGPGEFDPPVFVEGSSSKYIAHCDRLSGLVQPNEDTAELPHYDLGIGIGKSLVYLIYQADGIQNNAPILGSFTSILIGPDLEQKNLAIIDYPDLISASITCVETDDGMGNTFTTCTSNLSSQVINQIQNDLNDIHTLFNGRRIHDENYYTNASSLLEKYEEMKRYKDPGQTEKELFVDIIGTERLKGNLP
jgi:hypothetical protein